MGFISLLAFFLSNLKIIFLIVMMERTSCWFRRMVDSLKYSDQGLTTVSSTKKKETLCTTTLQKRVITSPSSSHEKGSPPSSTHSVEMPHPAVDYCERAVKKVGEEEEYELPPRKKISLAEQAGQGASNKPDLDGVSLMQSYRPIVNSVCVN